MNKYLATVRVGGQSVKTVVFADSAIHAKLLLQYNYGMNCIASAPVPINADVCEQTLLDTIIKPKPPLTPEQARLQGLKNNVENSRKQLQAERDRQRKQREAERLRKQQQRL